ncbi:hypothetical protein [Streptomyces sp. NPDC001661]
MHEAIAVVLRGYGSLKADVHADQGVLVTRLPILPAAEPAPRGLPPSAGEVPSETPTPMRGFLTDQAERGHQ